MTARPLRSVWQRVCVAAVVAALAGGGCRYRTDTAATRHSTGPRELMRELGARVAAVSTEGRPIRVAVAALVPTQADLAERNDFGTYFAERMTTELEQSAGRIRLFERSRLEVIMRENALTLSGMLNTETAARIGELAPVDYILTGSYTRLANAVSVNARLLDVVSGEIVFTSSAELPLTSDLAGLLEPISPVEELAKQMDEALDPCASIDARIGELLVDLSSSDKVRRLVNEAIATPFDTGCGAVHFRILGRFSRHGISDDKYVEFLLATLAGIEEPMADRRAQMILRYLHGLGPLSDRDWETGLSVVRTIGNDYLNVYLGYLFHTRQVDEAHVKAQYPRVDRVLALARAGKIGLPVPLEYGTVFLELIGALGPYIEPTDKRLIVYAYERDGGEVLAHAPRRHLKILRSVFRDETDPELRTKVFGWICDIYNRQEPSPRLASTLFDQARELHGEAADPNRPRAEREMYARLFAMYTKRCDDQLSRTLGMLTSESRRKQAAAFCFAHGIEVPELALSVDSLVSVLDSSGLRAQRDAAELLVVMGDAAGPAESTVLKLLRRRDRLRGSGVTNLLWSLVAILGNIRTSNPEAHGILVQCLESRNHAVPDSVQAALARIGDPVLPLLKRELPNTAPTLQIRIVEVFGMMGAAARSELPYLRKLMSRTTDAYVRDALKEAIGRIERARG